METNTNLHSLTVQELTLIAKHRGLSGYSKLNKTALVDLIGRTTPDPRLTSLGMPVPPIAAPILTPTAPVSVESDNEKQRERKRIDDIADWILNAPVSVKNLMLSLKDTAWKTVKKCTKSV